MRTANLHSFFMPPKSTYMLYVGMSVVSLTSRFANVLRRFANVFSRFAHFVKLLKFIELTIYQICLKIFSLVVDKRTKNNLYMH